MRLIDADLLTDGKGVFSEYIKFSNDFVAYIEIQDFLRVLDNITTAFDTEKVVEQLNNVLQDLNVIEVIDHIDFDSTIQTSLENFLNAFKSEIMRIVKNNACIDELLKGEEG